MPRDASSYIHKDGQSEPEVETTEYDGRLSKDEINRLAADSQRIEVRLWRFIIIALSHFVSFTAFSGSAGIYLLVGTFIALDAY